MNFNQLRTAIKKCLIISTSVLFVIGCNDEKSANNSTPETSETDTTVAVNPPVTKAKKSGKVSTNVCSG